MESKLYSCLPGAAASTTRPAAACLACACLHLQAKHMPNWYLPCREDLQRMRKPADVLTAEEIAQLRKDAERRIEEQQAVSKARKEHMLKVWQTLAGLVTTLDRAPPIWELVMVVWPAVRARTDALS